MRAARALLCLSLLLLPAAASAPLPTADAHVAPPGAAAAAAEVAAAGAEEMLELPTGAMKSYLVSICDWILTLDVGSNVLKGNYTPASAPTHIFIVRAHNPLSDPSHLLQLPPRCRARAPAPPPSRPAPLTQGETRPVSPCLTPLHLPQNGNFARVLLGAYKITGNTTYLAEGLRWCDTLVGLQYTAPTSSGAVGGYWDTGYETIYIADTGTAVTVLVLGYHMSTDAAQKASYLLALEKFSRFVTGGCKTVPHLNSTSTPLGSKCPPKGRGWVNTEGEDAGSLGDGYYKGSINLTPYTIATATTGSCTFSELTSIASSSSWGIPLEQISAAAVRWILDSRDADGVIPYTITPKDPAPKLYQPITYSCESFVSSHLSVAALLLEPARRFCLTGAMCAQGVERAALPGDGAGDGGPPQHHGRLHAQGAEP